MASTCDASDPSAQRLCNCYTTGQCPTGWTYYHDDGTEGHDSCLIYNSFPLNFTNAVSWCPSGTHLATINAPNAGVSRLYGTLLGLSEYYLNQQSSWIGCSQAWAQPYKNFGWRWIDSTSNGNLYNGTANITSYGMWSGVDTGLGCGRPK